MLTILIITYICGMSVTGFILTMISMFSNLSRAAYNITTIICMIVWPVIWVVLMGITTLIGIGYGVWMMVGKLIGRKG